MLAAKSTPSPIWRALTAPFVTLGFGCSGVAVGASGSASVVTGGAGRGSGVTAGTSGKTSGIKTFTCLIAKNLSYSMLVAIDPPARPTVSPKTGGTMTFRAFALEITPILTALRASAGVIVFIPVIVILNHFYCLFYNVIIRDLFILFTK